MRNFICLLLLAVLSFSSVQAQNIDQEELKKGIDQIEEEMAKVFKGFSQLLSNSSELTQDTTIMKFFNFPLTEMDSQFKQLQPDSLMVGDMFDLMQNQMLQFSQQDWSELEKLFKNFGDQLQMIPAPESGNDSPQKKKKKRKTTSM